ncbi:40S ribosomal protein S7, partial [Galemys pyrenaicus]
DTKIIKPKVKKPKSASPEGLLKVQLQEVNLTAPKETEGGGVFLEKIQVQLVLELEKKKFNRKHMVFIAQRKILPKPT